MSNFNIMKTLALFLQAGLFWCLHNPLNSDMDYMRIYTHGGGGSGQVVVDTAPPHCCQIWFVSGCSGLYTVLHVSSPESGHRPQEPGLFEPSMQPSPGGSGHSPVPLLTD